VIGGMFSQRRRDAKAMTAFLTGLTGLTGLHCCRAEGSLAVVWSAAARRRFHKGGLPPFTAQGPAPAVKSGGQPPHSIRAESPILVATASSRCNEARRQRCRRHLRAESNGCRPFRALLTSNCPLVTLK